MLTHPLATLLGGVALLGVLYHEGARRVAAALDLILIAFAAARLLKWI